MKSTDFEEKNVPLELEEHLADLVEGKICQVEEEIERSPVQSDDCQKGEGL